MGRLKRVAVAGVVVAPVVALGGCGWFQHPSNPAGTAATPTTSAPAPRPTVSSPPPVAPRYSYTVQPRDYMDGIAQADGVTPAQLEALNPQIPDPHWIEPGETVWLPRPLQSIPPKLPVVVQPPQLPCDGTMTAAQGASSAYAGHGVARFVITNGSNRDCTLDGFPSLVPEDAAGAPIAVGESDGVGQATQGAPVPVTLVPGAKAQFRVEWSDVTDNPAACIASQKVVIVLPGQKTPIVIPATVRACPEGGAVTPQLSVGAVTPLLDF